jgi:Phasin protein
MAESAIDSTAEDHDTLAQNVWRNAARVAMACDLPVTVCHDGRHLRFHPDGHVDDLTPPFGLDDAIAQSGLPKFELPNIEIPVAFREFADTVAVLAGVGFDIDPTAEPSELGAARTANNETLAETHGDASHACPTDRVDAVVDDCVEGSADDPPDESLYDPEECFDPTAERSESAFANTAGGTTEFSLVVMEAACVNANAMLEFTSAVLRAKSLSEMVELSTSHARKQIEAVTEQTKQLAAVTERMAPKKSGANES